MLNALRLCKKCNLVKSIKEFYVSNPHMGCKPCKAIGTKADQVRNRAKWRNYSKRWYAKMALNDPDKYRGYLKTKKAA